MRRAPRIVIVSAGIVGSATAVALRRRGAEVAVYDHLPSRWARLRRALEYTARRLFHPDGTVHRAAWLCGYDVMGEANYRAVTAPQPTAAAA